jgi:hypothetical protein
MSCWQLWCFIHGQQFLVAKGSIQAKNFTSFYASFALESIKENQIFLNEYEGSPFHTH